MEIVQIDQVVEKLVIDNYYTRSNSLLDMPVS
jgi:hypothetical protein